MQDLFFYLFAALTLLCAFLVVANPFSRDPVSSAMFLVLTIVSMAGLFVLLHAFFLAAVQVLVYAGAVIVLFLFVIMLLDLKEEQRRKINTFGVATGVISVGAIAVIFIKAIVGTRSEAGLPAPRSWTTQPRRWMSSASPSPTRSYASCPGAAARRGMRARSSPGRLRTRRGSPQGARRTRR